MKTPRWTHFLSCPARFAGFHKLEPVDHPWWQFTCTRCGTYVVRQPREKRREILHKLKEEDRYP